MTDEHLDNGTGEHKQGLFQRYPKLGVILVAGVAYAMLLAMCVVVAILIVSG